MANLTYTSAKANLNTQDWTAGTFRVLLAESGYTPNAAHVNVSDITNEATGVGYARMALTGNDRVIDGNNIDYIADALTWTPITSAFQYIIVYFDVAGDDSDDTTAQLVCALDLGGTQNFTAATFTAEFGGTDPGPVFSVA